MDKTTMKRKKNCCFFCYGHFSNIAIHFEKQHADEEEVHKFSILPKGCKERRSIIDVLRKKGNFQEETLEKRIIPVRRISRKDSRDIPYTACPNCKGFYSKNSLRKHFARCQLPNRKHPHYGKSLMILSKEITLNFHPTTSNILKNIMSRMRNDDIFSAICQDPLIISYGNKLCKKLKDPHHAKEIRAKLRQLGRFLIEIKKINLSVSDFCSIFQPQHYDSCIETVQKLSNINNNFEVFQNPTVALSMGTLLKKIGKHMKTYIIKNRLNEKYEHLKKFLLLLDEDYGTQINKTAVENISKQKRCKTIKLPTVDDLTVFYNYLCKKRQENYELCKKNVQYVSWKALAAYTLTSIQVYNRRRPGESERMLISDLENTKSIDYEKDRDLFNSFDVTEKDAAKEYLMVPLRGKLNRTVYAIIDRKSYKCLKLIVHLREELGVQRNNPYVFGLPGADTREHRHLDACALMRTFSSECGAKDPTTLRATLLRKHLATNCTVLGLKDNEIANVADHLGHHENIHKEFYRMSVPTREITKMSKLLNKTLEKPQNMQQVEMNIEDMKLALETDYPALTTGQVNKTAKITFENSECPITNNVKEADLEKTEFIYCTITKNDERNSETSYLGEMNKVLDASACIVNDSMDASLGGDYDEFQSDICIKVPSPLYFEECHQQDNLQNTNKTQLLPCLVNPDHNGKGTKQTDITSKQDKGAPGNNRELKVVISPLKLYSNDKIIEGSNDDFISSSESSDWELHNEIAKICEDNSDEEGSSDVSLTPPPRKKSRKIIKKNTWTSPEKALVRRIFYKNFRYNKIPTHDDCKNVIDTYPDLKRRTPRQLYAWLYYHINRVNKTEEPFSKRSYNADQSKKIERNVWLTPEKEVVRKLFKKHIDNRRLPKFTACKKAIKDYPALKNRTAKQLYAYVNNQITKAHKMGSNIYSPSAHLRHDKHFDSPKKTVVRQLFSKQIQNKEEVKYDHIAEKLLEHPILQNTSVKSIKALVDHEIKRKKFAEKQLLQNND